MRQMEPQLSPFGGCGCAEKDVLYRSLCTRAPGFLVMPETANVTQLLLASEGDPRLVLDRIARDRDLSAARRVGEVIPRIERRRPEDRSQRARNTPGRHTGSSVPALCGRNT